MSKLHDTLDTAAQHLSHVDPVLKAVIASSPLPTGDLGIRNGFQKLYDLNERPVDAEIEAIARINNWHPYESAASWYIWRSLDNKPAL